MSSLYFFLFLYVYIYIYISNGILLFLAASQHSSNSFQSQWACAREQILKLARWHVPFVRFRVHHVSFQLKWTHVEQWSPLTSVLTLASLALPPLFSQWNHPICFRHLSNHAFLGHPPPLLPLSRVSSASHCAQLYQIRDRRGINNSSRRNRRDALFCLARKTW